MKGEGRLDPWMVALPTPNRQSLRTSLDPKSSRSNLPPHPQWTGVGFHWEVEPPPPTGRGVGGEDGLTELRPGGARGGGQPLGPGPTPPTPGGRRCGWLQCGWRPTPPPPPPFHTAFSSPCGPRAPHPTHRLPSLRPCAEFRSGPSGAMASPTSEGPSTPQGINSDRRQTQPTLIVTVGGKGGGILTDDPRVAEPPP